MATNDKVDAPERIMADSSVYEAHSTTGCCQYCGNTLTYILPVTPLYTLEQTAAIIPCSAGHLRTLLTLCKDVLGTTILRQFRTRYKRLLRAWEVQLLRNHCLHTPNPDSPTGRKRDFLVRIWESHPELFARDQFPPGAIGYHHGTSYQINRIETNIQEHRQPKPARRSRKG